MSLCPTSLFLKYQKIQKMIDAWRNIGFHCYRVKRRTSHATQWAQCPYVQHHSSFCGVRLCETHKLHATQFEPNSNGMDKEGFQRGFRGGFQGFPRVSGVVFRVSGFLWCTEDVAGIGPITFPFPTKCFFYNIKKGNTTKPMTKYAQPWSSTGCDG